MLMNVRKEMSVFDIIGPNMIGPSSSHTAGALRIAKLARNMVKRPVLQVKFILYGSFAETYKGHGTDRALVAGMLDFDTEDIRIKDSFFYAKEAGLNYSFDINREKKDIHPNTVDIIITDDKLEETSVTGVSIGGGRAVIKKINGVDIDLSGEYHTIVIKHRDLPGAIARITEILSNFSINIAYMKLYRETKGTIAYSVIEADDPIIMDVVDKIEELPSVFHGLLIDRF